MTGDEHLDAATPPATDLSGLADHLFRHESAKLISVLTGIFGIERLQMAEDVVQEAMVRALKTWPFYGVPKNPAAWLTQTAKNFALDLIRREKTFHEKESQIIAHVENLGANESDSAAFDNEIKDQRLRLMFACCHPQIPEESQTALALKTLCAFSPAEIAKAFLTTEAAVAKRLVRARQRIKELAIRFEIPSGEDAAARLDSVLQTLYLLFNEGYKASSGDRLVREDLCQEAIRLVTLLVEQPAGNFPRTHALLALMLFNAARFSARTDDAGNILRLKDQDRSLWNKKMIARGLFHLAQAAVGNEATPYHLQAGIAACHSLAPTYEATDWKRILSLYDQLLALEDSPVIALNRAVALAQVEGPEAGLAALQAIKNRSLDSYYLLYSALAEFEAQRKNFTTAADHLRKAVKLTEVKSEQTFLQTRLHECERALES